MGRLCGVLCALTLLGFAYSQERDDPKPEVTIKRRHEFTEEDLRKQLQAVPELGFDQVGAKGLMEAVRGGSAPRDAGPRYLKTIAAKFGKPAAAALPWQEGNECETGKDDAEAMHAMAIQLRRVLRAAVPAGDVRPDVDAVRRALTRGQWKKPEAVPTITQILQAENRQSRLLLVEILAEIDGKRSAVALAKRALFDLSPEVREKAIQALASRPSKDYLPVLVEGFSWTWQPVADHAAEAIISLQPEGAIEAIAQIANDPDPKLPKEDGKIVVVREMVRINHMSNCLLCHAPSSAKKDLVRGAIPPPLEEMVERPDYYEPRDGGGDFVHADITFIRQEFSVVQPVQTPLKWPANQRFDYMLRTRKATPPEAKLLQQPKSDPPPSYPQREAAIDTLRSLTGKKLDSTKELTPDALKSLIRKPL